jgi:membrane protease subunit HflC
MKLKIKPATYTPEEDSAKQDIEIKPSQASFTRKLKLLGLRVGLYAAAGLLAYSSLYTVDQTEHAVITTFGSPSRVVLNSEISNDVRLETEKLKADYNKEGVDLSEGAGLKMKWPWQRVNKVDKRIQRWDGYPEEIATRDKKYLWIDTTARFFVENPLKYFRTVGNEAVASAKLSDILDAEARNIITKHDLIEIVRTDNRPMEITEKELINTVLVDEVKKGRTKILEEISNASRTACHEYGLRIHEVGVLIKGLKYVDSVKVAVEGRMIAERNRIAAKYISEGDAGVEETMGKKNKEIKRILSEGYKTAKEIEGAGDAEALRIYAEGFTEVVTNKETGVVSTNNAVGLNVDPAFYRFLKTMEVFNSGIAGSNKTSLLIGSDNPLLTTKNPFAESSKDDSSK